MKLQVKVILILAAVWLVVSLIIYADTKLVLAKNYQQLEKTLIEAEIADAERAFNKSLASLSLYTLAWSQWDEAYAFMTTKNQQFIKSNFVPGTFITAQLNFLFFYDTKAQLYYGKVYDNESGLLSDPPSYLLNFLAQHKNFVLHSKTTDKNVGILNTEHGLIIMDSLPIITSEGKGPIHGTLLMGYYLTSNHIKTLSETVGADIKLYPLPFASTNLFIKKAFDHLITGEKSYIINSNAKTAFGYILLRDIDNKPAAILSLKVPRIVNMIGINTNYHFYLSIITLAIILLLLMWYLLKYFVLNRIISISHQVVALNNENQFDQKLMISGHDELAHMVHSINHMMRLITLSQNQLRYMANHDPLTQLPNRTFFYELLDQEINKARSDHTRVAVLFLDMDKFKSVNDLYGHAVGDKLLKILAERLKQSIKKTDVVARQSGDEFIIFLRNVESDKQISETAERILQETSKEYVINGIRIHATFSMGISIYPTDSTNIEELIRFADEAMYAKKKQGNIYAFYNSSNITS